VTPRSAIKKATGLEVMTLPRSATPQLGDVPAPKLLGGGSSGMPTLTLVRGLGCAIEGRGEPRVRSIVSQTASYGQPFSHTNTKKCFRPPAPAAASSCAAGPRPGPSHSPELFARAFRGAASRFFLRSSSAAPAVARGQRLAPTVVAVTLAIVQSRLIGRPN